jgi:hypothetical protein
LQAARGTHRCSATQLQHSLGKYGTRGAIRSGSVLMLDPKGLATGFWRFWPLRIRNLAVRSGAVMLQMFALWMLFAVGGYALLCNPGVGNAVPCHLHGHAYVWFNSITAGVMAFFAFLITVPSHCVQEWIGDGACDDHDH